MNVGVHGAKTQLSKLLDMVEDDEIVVMERHGRAQPDHASALEIGVDARGKPRTGVFHVAVDDALPSTAAAASMPLRAHE